MNTIWFPLIVRNSYGGFHSGEIGFPGGKKEPTDKDFIETALREAQEEKGVVPADVTVLGILSDIYIGPSNFSVLPVVGYIPYRPNFCTNAREVKHLVEAKLHFFSDPTIIGHSEILIPGDRVVTPYYALEGYKVWGATAKVIAELLAIIK